MIRFRRPVNADDMVTTLVIRQSNYTKIAKKSGLRKKESEVALNTITETIVDGLKAGEKIELVGFGTFEVRDRAARVGRNPRTGEDIQIAASRVPAFKAGKLFKDALK